MRGKKARALGILFGMTVAAFFLHFQLGSSAALGPIDVLRELLHGPLGPDQRENFILWQLRLPRALGCVCVGGILGIVGSAFQAMFRNPLADPYIVGVSSGSAVGGALAMVLGLAGTGFGLVGTAMGFIGGMASLLLVYAFSQKRGQIDMPRFLLAGVVAGTLLSALLTLTILAAGRDTNQVMRWIMGSTSLLSWQQVGVIATVMAIGSAILIAESKRLNAFAMGEDTAQRLGISVGRLKRIVLTVGTAMVASTVGAVGIIGFVGLVAPHISRRLLGVDWRISLLGSLLIGCTVMLLADILAQRSIPYSELPVGVVTAVVGAPFLLILLRRQF